MLEKPEWMPVDLESYRKILLIERLVRDSRPSFCSSMLPDVIEFVLLVIDCEQ